jgi:hypothetical protein
MQSDEVIRGRIMRRVYYLFTLRQVGQPMVRATMFVSACLAVLPLVSVPHVIANIMKVTNLAGVTPFLLSAFMKTEFFVQLAFLLAGFILVWSVLDLVKGVGRAPAHA